MSQERKLSEVEFYLALLNDPRFNLGRSREDLEKIREAKKQLEELL